MPCVERSGFFDGTLGSVGRGLTSAVRTPHYTPNFILFNSHFTSTDLRSHGYMDGTCNFIYIYYKSTNRLLMSKDPGNIVINIIALHSCDLKEG